MVIIVKDSDFHGYFLASKRLAGLFKKKKKKDRLTTNEWTEPAAIAAPLYFWLRNNFLEVGFV